MSVNITYVYFKQIKFYILGKHLSSTDSKNKHEKCPFKLDSSIDFQNIIDYCCCPWLPARGHR